MNRGLKFVWARANGNLTLACSAIIVCTACILSPSAGSALALGRNKTGPGGFNAFDALENLLPASQAELKAEAADGATDRDNLRTVIQWLGKRLSALEVRSFHSSPRMVSGLRCRLA
ncbi:hypothetical protein COCOBI_17-0440 [Coccomyxa sp. Obi]|nr:hypothetical protein COCOBI_17-0440 [Coccomyxa sp. Obi]